MSSNYNQIIENVCGPNVKIHTIFDLRFLRWRGPIELLLRIPLHKKKAALNALYSEIQRFTFEREEDLVRLACRILKRFRLENQFFFGEFVAPLGTDTVFLQCSNACNAFREIIPKMKNIALEELHRTSDNLKLPYQRQNFALNMFHRYKSRIESILGATTLLPRSIRQEDLLSDNRVWKALHSLEKSHRIEAVNAFAQSLMRQNIHNMNELQTLAISTFQLYAKSSISSTDCNHQQFHFEVEDTPPSTLSPSQSSSEDIQMITPEPNVDNSQSATGTTTSTSRTSKQPVVTIEPLPSTSTVAKMGSLSEPIPRKNLDFRKSVEAADRLHDIIADSLEIEYRFDTAEERRALVNSGKVRPSQVLQRNFKNKFGDKVATKILNLIAKWPSPLVDVWLRDYNSSIYNASDDFADKDTALLLECPKFRGDLEDHWIKTGCAVGPTAFPCRIKRNSMIDVLSLAFPPNFLGESSIQHLDKTHGLKGIFNEVLSLIFGLEYYLNAGYLGLDTLQVRMPRDTLTRLKDFIDNIPEDHKLFLLLKYIDECSKALLEKIVPTLLSTTLSRLGVEIKSLFDRRSEMMEHFHDSTQTLKKNIPNLDIIKLGHPTSFSRESRPSEEKYDGMKHTIADIFASYAASYDCDVEEVLDSLSEDDMQSILKVFKMGHGPTTSERNKERAGQIAQSSFLNGSTITGKECTQATREKIGNAHRGRIVSKATGEKISNALTGIQRSQATRERLSNALIGRKPSMGFKGKRHSEATKEKMRNNDAPNTGIKPSKITREKISKGLTGIKRSKATREKISKAKKGVPQRKREFKKRKPHTKATKEKIGKANKGNKHTEATKQKMRETKKRKKLEREAEERKKQSQATKGKNCDEDNLRKKRRK